MTTDVFGNTQEQPSADDKLAGMIGEGKKYANEQEALKALVFSQDHITQLESEMEGLRTDLDKRLGAEEILNKLNERKANEGASTNTGEGDPSSVKNSGLTKEDVLDVVSQLKQSDTVNANRTEANEYIKATYGDKGTEIVTSRANTLGMSVAQLQSIAENSPTAFKALITDQANPGGSGTVPTVTSQGVDSTQQGDGTVQHGTKQFYDNMRKTAPKEYWSPATQNALHRAAQADPTKFFGN